VVSRVEPRERCRREPEEGAVIDVEHRSEVLGQWQPFSGRSLTGGDRVTEFLSSVAGEAIFLPSHVQAGWVIIRPRQRDPSMG